ncbi:MAG: aminodeoxychorismate/anthranilate synthase component II [Candidatus Marinimicrobia bacterium]|nr:aminodeoxychorismate/anthranilate synthase component II [Candidatus Neomarinimicrobiota bacterium]
MQKILLIDNNDSFTYNVVDYLRRMDKVEFQVIKSSDLDLSDLEIYDKIIISPGPGLPKDFPLLFKVFEKYLTQKPILGICLGHQALAEYLGGSLIQLDPVVHGQAHRMRILRHDPIFEGIPREIHVGLYHSWAVDPKTLPASLDLLAESEGKIIMAVKHKDYPVYGLQFHPESYVTERGLRILQNFVEGIWS